MNYRKVDFMGENKFERSKTILDEIKFRIKELLNFLQGSGKEIPKTMSYSLGEPNVSSVELQREKDSFEKHLIKRAEFLKGNHNIFDDNNLSEQEIDFFKIVYDKVLRTGNNPALLKLNRLSDKTINVQYIDMQIGRIKLQGRKTKMQILITNGITQGELDVYDLEWIENRTFDFYIESIERWMNYLLTILKNGCYQETS